MRFSPIALAAAALLWGIPAAASSPDGLDGRVELLAALEWLGDPAPPRAFTAASPYAKSLKSLTAGCRSHPAVAFFDRLRRTPGREDWPAMGLVLLSECLDEGLSVRADEACRRSAPAAAAADFARACYAPVRSKAESALGPERKALAAWRLADPVPAARKAFAEYVGSAAGPTRAAASPLLAPGRAWNGLRRHEEAFSVLLVRGPRTDGGFETEGLAAEVWHENAHGVLDPLLSPELAAGTPPKDIDLRACYGSWAQCVREHMAQGLALRLSRRAGGPAEPPEEKRRRLPRLKAAADALERYEKDRARWPTLAQFYPEWVKVLGGTPGEAGAAAPAAPARDAELDAALALASKDPGAGERALEALAARASPGGAALLSLAVLKRGKDKKAAAELAGRAVEAARRGDGGAWLLPDALSTRATWREEDGDARGAAADRTEALAAAPLDWPRRGETAARLGRR